MRFISAYLTIEDTCNPCNEEALEYVREMLSEVFGKEEMKEHPRCKLLIMQVEHRYPHPEK